MFDCNTCKKGVDCKSREALERLDQFGGVVGCSGYEPDGLYVEGERGQEIVAYQLNPTDNVNHPSHYETGKFECFDVMLEALGEEVVKGFCIGNAFKYIYRHRRKNGVEDIKKAIWYLNKVVGLEEGEQK